MTSPISHAIFDGFADRAACAELAAAWPGPDWSGWVGYDPAIEGKRASDLTTPVAGAAAAALARVAASDPGLAVGLQGTVADLGLHGAGLHEMPPGGHLGCHLDASHHPRLGLERAWSAVLWVHQEWEAGWGGELRLHDAARRIQVAIEPRPGRLVVFATGPLSWHSVARVTGPAARRSLALFGYRAAAAVGAASRPRALFVAGPDEDTGAAAEQARATRAR